MQLTKTIDNDPWMLASRANNLLLEVSTSNPTCSAEKTVRIKVTLANNYFQNCIKTFPKYG